MNVSLTEKQFNYISNQINSGDFQNGSEVVRDALRLHKYYREIVVKSLRDKIREGINSIDSSRTVLDILAGRFD